MRRWVGVEKAAWGSSRLGYAPGQACISDASSPAHALYSAIMLCGRSSDTHTQHLRMRCAALCGRSSDVCARFAAATGLQLRQQLYWHLCNAGPLFDITS